MTNNLNKLKPLFQSNTIVNIQLGLMLALGQGCTWEYIAEKCLTGWLVDQWKGLDENEVDFYPINLEETIYFGITRVNGVYTIKKQFNSTNYKIIIKNENNLLKESIQPMIEFLKLIHET